MHVLFCVVLDRILIYGGGIGLCPTQSWDLPNIFQFPEIHCLSCTVTREATRIKSFSQQISSPVLLVANKPCAKTLQSSEIFYTRLQVRLLFVSSAVLHFIITWIFENLLLILKNKTQHTEACKYHCPVCQQRNLFYISLLSQIREKVLQT